MADATDLTREVCILPYRSCMMTDINHINIINSYHDYYTYTKLHKHTQQSETHTLDRMALELEGQIQSTIDLVYCDGLGQPQSSGQSSSKPRETTLLSFWSPTKRFYHQRNANPA